MISVVVPLYQSASTVVCTLESIKASLERDFECVIVNDGSTDEGPRLAESFCNQDSRFRMVSQPNRGLSAARNTGIAESSGEFLYFLDADDVVYPNGLQILNQQLRHHSDCGVAYSGYAIIDELGQQIETVNPRGKLETLDFFFSNPFPVHACLTRRHLVDETGMFDTSLRSLEDWDLWLRLARCGIKFASVSGVVGGYRRTPGSMSSSCSRMFQAYKSLSTRFISDPRLAGKGAFSPSEGDISLAICTMNAFYLGWAISQANELVISCLEQSGEALHIFDSIPFDNNLQSAFCFGLGVGTGITRASSPKHLQMILDKFIPELVNTENKISNNSKTSRWLLNSISSNQMRIHNTLVAISQSKWHRFGKVLGLTGQLNPNE